MTIKEINSKISYIESSNDPLCADIGIVKSNSGLWLFDVGNGKENLKGLNEEYNIALSHFHLDHIGNIENINAKAIYSSNETNKHIGGKGIVVDNDIFLDDIHIFPLPSSHAKGCLGMEVDEEYAFIGDGLYCKVKDNCLIFNSQILKETINVLKSLKASTLLQSHLSGLKRDKQDAIEELEKIYSLRTKDSFEIKLERN